MSKGEGMSVEKLRGKKGQEQRARWLWEHRAEWGNLPAIDPEAAMPLFRAMQRAGLYSKKTAAIDGRSSIQKNCDLAREMHRRGDL